MDIYKTFTIMRRTRRISLYLSICILAITSCAKKDCCEPVLQEGQPLSHVAISVKDNQGNDLLNPSNPNSLKANSISLEHVYGWGSEKVDYDEKNNKIKIIKHPNLQDLYVLLLQSNLKLDSNSKSKTIIKWNDIETDTMEVEFSHDSKKIKSVSINDVIIWNDWVASALPPTIIK